MECKLPHVSPAEFEGELYVAKRRDLVADNEFHPSHLNLPVYFVDIDNVLRHRTEVLDEGLALPFAPEQSKEHLRVGSERAGTT